MNVYTDSPSPRLEKQIEKEGGYRVSVSPEARAGYNSYMRAYRSENKEKIKEINARYWQKKSQQKEPTQTK